MKFLWKILIKVMICGNNAAAAAAVGETNLQPTKISIAHHFRMDVISLIAKSENTNDLNVNKNRNTIVARFYAQSHTKNVEHSSPFE